MVIFILIKLNSLRSSEYSNSFQSFFAINPNIPWKSFPWDAWTHSKKNTWKKVCKSFLFKVEIQQFWLCNFFLWSNLKSYLIEKFYSNNFRFRDDLKWVCFIPYKISLIRIEITEHYNLLWNMLFVFSLSKII